MVFFSRLLTTTLLIQLYLRVGILLACRTHVHEFIISLKGEVWAQKTSWILSHFIKVTVPKQESERACIYICVSKGYTEFDSVSKISRLDFRTVPTMCYLYFFILLLMIYVAKYSNPALGEVYSIQHYAIKFVSDLRQVDVSSTNKTDRHGIAEILLNTICLALQIYRTRFNKLQNLYCLLEEIYFLLQYLNIVFLWKPSDQRLCKMLSSKRKVQIKK